MVGRCQGPQHSKLLISSYPNERAEVSGGKKLQVTWVPYNLTGANIWVSDVTGQAGFEVRWQESADAMPR